MVQRVSWSSIIPFTKEATVPSDLIRPTLAVVALATLAACAGSGGGEDGEDTGQAPPTDAQIDADEDGFSAAVDCDDTDAKINPGADEVCDGVDNDCNDLVDEEDDNLDPSSALQLFADADGDTFGDPTAPELLCEPREGFVADASDCDDSSELVRPGAPEVCDTVDNDCNAATVETGVGFQPETGAPRSLSAQFPEDEPVNSYDGYYGYYGEVDPKDWSFVKLREPGTLYLCPGTYYASIEVEADVAIVGVGGSDQVTLDGVEVFPGVWVEGAHDVTVDGLTLANTADRLTTDRSERYGAGLRCADGATLTADDVVLDNGGSRFGGAIGAVSDCSLTLTNSTVRGGLAETGGHLAVVSATAVVSDTTFLDGQADGHGGSVMLNLVPGPAPGPASLTCTRCTFEGNTAGARAGGWAGTVAVGPDATLTMSEGGFFDNDGDNAGGSIYLVPHDVKSPGPSIAALTDVQFVNNVGTPFGDERTVDVTA